MKAYKKPNRRLLKIIKTVSNSFKVLTRSEDLELNRSASEDVTLLYAELPDNELLLSREIPVNSCLSFHLISEKW